MSKRTGLIGKLEALKKEHNDMRVSLIAARAIGINSPTIDKDLKYTVSVMSTLSEAIRELKGG